ncbi:MAG: hydroxyacylglutathione hydrolase [Candidatus Krumholzibacteriia bacterium]
MQFDDAVGFVEFMTKGQPSRPANVEEIIAINQGRSPLTMGEPTALALTPDELEKRVAAGGIVVDGRDSAVFGGGHIPGAFNIKMETPEFEQRVGWVVPKKLPIFLVLDSDLQLPVALRKLAFVGLDSRVEGFLGGGMGAWTAAGKSQATLSQISATELAGILAGDAKMRVLDVREIDEWSAGHIDDAATMSFKLLADRIADIGIGADEELSVICAGGIRSSTACSILLRNGYTRLRNVTGGMWAWRAAARPAVTD